MSIAGLGTAATLAAATLQVGELPSLPRPLAGQFVGTLDGALVVAGGSRWTAPPSQGGRKIYEDAIQVLGPESTQWEQVARLPQGLAYGGTASLGHTLVFAGGQDESLASSRVWALTRQGTNYEIAPWPSLPSPVANFSMALVGRRIYILGGQESAAAGASSQLWSLAIDGEEHPASNWRVEAALPGAGRILAAAAGCHDALYILGGATLAPAADGSLVRRYLTEAWRFQASLGWKKLEKMPAASVAAPAECDADGNVWLIGGDDGHMAGVVLQPGEQHPGFSRSIWRLSRVGQSWTLAGELPLGLVTTGSAVWKDGRIAVPGGEDRPGNRSSRVLELIVSR